MTQGPWSVKGIDPKARAIARERAQRQGQTLGQYLNKLLIEEVGDNDSEGAETRSQKPSGDAFNAFAEEISAEIPKNPHEIKDIRKEIDALARKLEASQSRSSRAMSGVDKSMMGLANRVDDSTKSQLGALSEVSRAMTEIRSTQTALRDRMDSLENDDTADQTVGALKELESALGNLSDIVQHRADKQDDEQSSLRSMLDHHVDDMSNRLNSVERNIDSTTGPISDRVNNIEGQLGTFESRMDTALGRITDATSRFELFEDKAGKAIAETAQHTENLLEQTTEHSRKISQDLQNRVTSIEEQTRDAVTSLGDTVSRIINRLDDTDNSASDAIRSVEKKISGLGDQFDRLADSQRSKGEQLESQLQRRLDTLAEDLWRPIRAVREDVEKQIKTAIDNDQSSNVAKLEQTLAQVQNAFQESENRQSTAILSMSEQVERLSIAVDDRLTAMEQNSANNGAVDQLREDMMELTRGIEERLAFAETDRRMNNAGLEGIKQEFQSIQENVDGRLNEITDQVTSLTENGVSGSHEDFDKLAAKIDERVRESEQRSAEAITQIGEQVARVAERLQNQQRESFENLEEKLAESGRSHEERLNDAVSDMSRRLSEIGDDTATALRPLQNTVSSIATRVSNLEDGTAQPAPTTPVAPTPELVAQVTNDIEIPPLVDEADPADIVGIEPPPFDETKEDLFGNAAVEDTSGIQVEDVALEDFADDAETTATPAVEILEEPIEEPTPDTTSDDDITADEFDIHEAQAIEASDETGNDEPAATPADEIDDLLDIDDLVLEEPPASSEFVADLPDAPENGEDLDYLTKARRAAKVGNLAAADSANSGGKVIGKGPLMASAALALAVASGGAWSVMRGKQDAPTTGDDNIAAQDPAAPLTDTAAAGSPEAAEEVLFNANDTATEPTVLAENTTPEELFEPASLAELTTPTPELTLEDAVAAGDPIAQHDHALELLQTGEKAAAVTLLKQAASENLVMAQYRLAKLYERGEGVPRDMASSRRWTEQAAMGGNIRAMHDLAVFYAEGDAGPQSYAASVEWFRQASDLGLVDSQYNLAVLYEQGLGVSEDRSEAAFWFEVAGRAGDEDAMRRARGLLSDMPTTLADQVRRRARTFSPRLFDARANGEFGMRSWEQPNANQISELQRLLNSLGYEAGTPDGEIGARTSEAIRAFEADNGLPPKGEATLSVLRLVRTSKPSSAG